MSEELPIPLWDNMYIEPVVTNDVLSKSLNSYAKVLSIGKDVQQVKVGDYIHFEKWDKPEVLKKDGTTAHYIKESDAISIVPPSWV